MLTFVLDPNETPGQRIARVSREAVSTGPMEAYLMKKPDKIADWVRLGRTAARKAFELSASTGHKDAKMLTFVLDPEETSGQ